mmetsp:Transcript_67355/g.124056  ORF Transcript_67355/g.124056 Transcript_67355/m.124056 type:complete len:304 (+) Transcript_67355:63-974(+)
MKVPESPFKFFPNKLHCTQCGLEQSLCARLGGLPFLHADSQGICFFKTLEHIVFQVLAQGLHRLCIGRVQLGLHHQHTEVGRPVVIIRNVWETSQRKPTRFRLEYFKVAATIFGHTPHLAINLKLQVLIRRLTLALNLKTLVLMTFFFYADVLLYALAHAVHIWRDIKLAGKPLHLKLVLPCKAKHVIFDIISLVHISQTLMLFNHSNGSVARTIGARQVMRRCAHLHSNHHRLLVGTNLVQIDLAGLPTTKIPEFFLFIFGEEQLQCLFNTFLLIHSAPNFTQPLFFGFWLLHQGLGTRIRQ